MPANAPFPLPSSFANLIQWAMQNPDEIDELIRFINRLKALQVSITNPSTARPYSLIDADDNALLSVGIKFQTPVAAPTGGAVIDVECRAQLAALLTALNIVGMN